MNRIFCLVFNRTLGAFVVASELASPCARASRSRVAAGLLLSPLALLCAPTWAQSCAGVYSPNSPYQPLGSVYMASAKPSPLSLAGAAGANEAVGSSDRAESGGGGGAAGSATLLNCTTQTLSAGLNVTSTGGSGGYGRDGFEFIGIGKDGGNGGNGGNGGDILVENLGGIVTAGNGTAGHGIYAVSSGGVGGAAGNGSGSADGGLGGNGGNGGDVNALNYLGAAIQTTGTDADGIHLQSEGGAASAGGSGGWLLGVSGNGGAGGNSGSDVSADNRGSITTSGSDSEGIYAHSVGGQGADGGSHASGGFLAVGGDGGPGGLGGNVAIDNLGAITTHGSQAEGIDAQSIGGGGGDGGHALAAAPVLSVAVGGSGGGGGNAGSVSVWNAPGASITTTAVGAGGIVAKSIGGGGGDGGYADAVAAGVPGASLSFALGMGGSGGSGGNGGASPDSADSASIAGNISNHQVSSSPAGFATYVSNGGNIITGDVSLADQWSTALNSGNSSPQALPGDSSDGILAQSIGGGGGRGGNVITVSVAANVGLSVAVGTALGGSGGSGGVGENVGVNNLDGSIVTYGRNAEGIVAQSIGGGGGEGGSTLSVAAALGGTLGGHIGVSLGGSGGSGGAAGQVLVNPGSGVTTMGTGSIGILAQSIGGGGGNGGSVTDVGVGVGMTAVTLGVSLGGKGGSGGAGNTVLVSNAGYTSSTLSTFGDNADGILAQSIGGGGGNGGSVQTYAISASGGYLAGTVNLGVGGSGGSGGTGGTAEVFYTGGITTYGDNSAGIKAQSVGGGGGNGGSVQALSIAASFNAKPGNSAQTVAVSVGGGGGSGQDGGVAHVELAQNAIVKTEGERSSGVFVQSIGGGGGNGGNVSSFAVSTSAPNLDTLKKFLQGEVGAYLSQFVTVPASTSLTSGAIEASAKFKWDLQDGEGTARTGDANDAGQSVKNHLAQFTARANSLIDNANNIIAQNSTINDSITENQTTIASQSEAQVEAQQKIAAYADDLSMASGSSAAAVTAQVQSQLNSAESALAEAQSALSKADPANPGYATAQANVTTAQSAVNEIQAYATGVAQVTGTLDKASSDIAAAQEAISKAKSSPYYSDETVNPNLLANAQSVKAQAEEALQTAQADPVKNADEANEQLAAAGSTNDELNESVGHTSDDGGNTDDNGGGSNGNGGGNGNPPTPTKIPNLTVNVAVGGFGGAGGDGESASVVLHAGAQIVTQGEQSYGVFVQSIGGGGGAGGNAQSSGLVGVNNYTIGLALGGFGSGGGNGGPVDVTSEANTSIATSGDGSHGMLAQSVGAGGGEGGSATEDYTASISQALGITDKNVIINVPSPREQTAITIGGYGGNAGNGGIVNVNVDTAITTTGTNAMGIVAQSIGGGGGNGNIAQTQSSMFEFDLGGSAGAGGSGGAVNVSSGGAINTSGSNAVGILAQSIGGGGGNGGVAKMSAPVNLGTVDADTEINSRGVAITPTIPWDLKLSIGGKGGAAGNGGNVLVGCGTGVTTPPNCAGAITTTGDVAHAIQAQSIGGGGGASQISNLAPGQGDISFQVWKGISYGNSGTVTVSDSAASHFVLNTNGDGAVGIVAQSLTNGGGSLGVDADTGLYALSYTLGDDEAQNGDGGADAGKPAANDPASGGDKSEPLIVAGCILVQGCSSSASVNGGTAIDLYGSVNTTGAAAYGIYAQSLSGASTVFGTSGARVEGGTDLVTGQGKAPINAIHILAGASVTTSGAGAHGIVSLTNSDTAGATADLSGGANTASHVQNTVIDGTVSVSGANAWGLMLENGSTTTSGVNIFGSAASSGPSPNALNVAGLQIDAGATVAYTGISDTATTYGNAGAVMVNNLLGSALIDVSGSIQAPDAVAVSVQSYGMQILQKKPTSAPKYTLDVHGGGTIDGGIIMQGASSSLLLEKGGNVTGYLAVNDATSAGALSSGSGSDNGASVTTVEIDGVFTGTDGARMLASAYNAKNATNYEGAVVDINNATAGDAQGIGAYITVSGTLNAGTNKVAAIHVVSPDAPAYILVKGSLVGGYGGFGDVIHAGLDDKASMARIENHGTILGNIVGPGVSVNKQVLSGSDGNSIANKSGGLIEGQVSGIYSYANAGTQLFDLALISGELAPGQAVVSVNKYINEGGSLRVALANLDNSFQAVTLMTTQQAMASDVLGTVTAQGLATTLNTAGSNAYAIMVDGANINYKVTGLSGDLVQAARVANTQVAAYNAASSTPASRAQLAASGLYSLLMSGANAPDLASLSKVLTSFDTNAQFSDVESIAGGSGNALNNMQSCGGEVLASVDPIAQGNCNWQKFTDEYNERLGGSQKDHAYGLTVGRQTEVADDLYFGISGEYENTHFSSGTATSNGDRLMLGGILKVVRGNAFASASIIGGYDWSSGQRNLLDDTTDATLAATSNHKAVDYTARLRAGYLFSFDGFDVTPMIDTNVATVHNLGYREQGAGSYNIEVHSNVNVLPDLHPVVQLGTHAMLGSVSARGYVEAGVRYQLSDIDAKVSYPDAFDPDAITAVTYRRDRAVATWSLGAILDWTDHVESRFTYEGERGDTTSGRTLTAKVAWKF